MESVTMEEERKERLVLDKKNVYCEGVRRSIEVLSHAVRLTFNDRPVDDGLTKKLTASIKDKIDKLDTALAELR